MKENLAGTQPSDQVGELSIPESDKRRKLKRSLVMYTTMVAVSTGAIFLLEHVSMFNAFRTALVAAVGKTLAANWVTGMFE